MKVYGQLESAQLEILTADPASSTLGRIYFNSVTKRVRYFDGSSWTALGTIAGSGIGNSPQWTNEGPDAALAAIENNQDVFLFTQWMSQKIYTTLRVPLSYIATNPIKLYIGAYSPGITGTWKMTATSYLVASGVDAFSSVAQSRSSEKAALTVTNSTPANKLVVLEIDITDTVGKIGTASVSPGDLIKIVLFREAGTDTEDTRILNVPSEVVYQ